MNPAGSPVADRAGLDPALESALGAPPEVEMYSENFMVAAYDPVADIGLWLHLGTVPTDFTLWEDVLLCALPPADGLVSSYGYHRTAPELRPAGANLRFACVEPFRRWTVSYDGVGVRSPYEEMLTGRLRDGAKEIVAFDLDVRCVAPAWDPDATPADGAPHGGMSEQVWASVHYEQLLRATGTITLGDRVVEFDGTGVRDHSLGVRGKGMDQFGGHLLVQVPFPDGRGVGLLRLWRPDGTITLDAAHVDLDGVRHPATVVEAPRLGDIVLAGDRLTLVLRTELGEHRLVGTMLRTLYLTIAPSWGMPFGADPAHGLGVFAPGFARWEWDGLPGYGLTERSEQLPHRAPELHR